MEAAARTCRLRATGNQVHHDGTPHVYEIVIPDPEKTSAIRIDPARGPGQLTLVAIELVTPEQTLDLLKQMKR